MLLACSAARSIGSLFFSVGLKHSYPVHDPQTCAHNSSRYDCGNQHKHPFLIRTLSFFTQLLNLIQPPAAHEQFYLLISLDIICFLLLFNTVCV